MAQKMYAFLSEGVAVPGPPGLPRVIQDEGVPLPVRTVIDMRGAGVTATDDEANDKTIITIPGGAADMVVSVFGRPGPAVTAQAGDYNWTQIASKPSVFPPEAHTHDWTADITGKPASFPPSAHVHAAADVTSGVFATGRLGSGTGSASNYLRGDGAWTALTAAQVSGVVPDTRTITAGTGLTGGGALSANITLNANIAGIQTPWLQDINAAGFALNYPRQIAIRANPLNAAGTDLYTGLILDRTYGDTGDTMDIVWPSSARISLNATGAGEKTFVFYAQTASGNGETYEVMRIGGNRRLGIGGVTPQYQVHAVHSDNCTIACETLTSTVAAIYKWLAPGASWEVITAGSGIGAPYGRALYINDVTGGGVRMLFEQGGAIRMWLGGSLKTLSVDGSGFVKAA